ncbi:MAG: beta-mannosidase [Candidatus Symbiothrix sp.]|jgi:mannan endo-1,4-beta-mannosidase|nr:beta-mannosidase [Candidatus Symbiothrix sp.]
MRHKIFLLSLLFLCLFSCGDKEEENTLKWLSSVPEDNAKAVSSLTTGEIVLTYDREIVIATPHGITLNGSAVTTKVAVSGKDLKIAVQLASETSYQLIVPAKKVQARTDAVQAGEVKISFQTQKEYPVEEFPLVVKNPSPEAVNLYNFLKENYGKKIISGMMANVNWNISETEWVYQQTGKYPALNGFDYIHLMYSPANWIDYGNTQVVENWWNNHGIVAGMWHWNVPQSKDSGNYAFYTTDTSFDIREAVKEGTYENGVVKADLEKIAGYLLLLKNKNIPVLWRPLHEAAGGWFWWGAKGPEPCKALWKMMFDYFEERELNNLIWIWTVEPKDIVGGTNVWYPGDEYVDIIGRDAYNTTTAKGMLDEYNMLKTRYPDKLITLSECGNVAGITEQWDAGATWSWFMPWYDPTNHSHASAAWWKAAFDNDKVISRDQMPSLK